MGSSISVDKHVSNLDDLLEISPKLFQKIKFEGKISENVTQHLKIWRFFDDRKKYDIIKTAAVPLNRLPETGFCFSSEEAYLVLFIYKSDFAQRSEIVSFPHSMWGVVESASNLTPRGLQNIFSSSVDNYFVHSLDSFLLSNRPQDDQTEFNYMLFVWNGKNTNALVKALALTKGYELDNLLQTGKDSILKVLYSGGVIRKKKLQRGQVINFNEIISNDVSKDLKTPPIVTPTSTDAKDLLKTYESVYLFKWLFPESSIVGEEAMKLRKRKTKPKCPLLLKEFYKPELQLPEDKTNEMQEREYMQLFDDIDDMIFSEEDEVSPQKEAEFEDYEMEEDEEEDQDHNIATEEQKSTGRSVSSAAKIEFKLVQANQVKGSARGDEKPKIGKLNFNKLGGLHQNEENTTPNDSPDQSRKSKTREQPQIIPMSRRIPTNELKLRGLGGLSKDEESDRPSGLALPLNSGLLITREQQFKAIKERGREGLNDDDMSGTVRNEWESIQFRHVMSQVIEGLLYLGGRYVAQNKELLKENKINRIINCSSDNCQNCFEDEFNYKSYHLKDSVRENIECVFYDAIAFIEDARRKGERVFIHCIQGVSRSATLCVAYLMHTRQYTHNQALTHVRERRQISNPNTSFLVQLIWFYKRRYLAYGQLTQVNPRIFMVSSHEEESPKEIVARLLMQDLFESKEGRRKKFDKRGLFIIQSVDDMAIWVGSQCKGLNRQEYMDYALRYISILQRYEKAASVLNLQKVKIVEEGQETSQFLKLWDTAAFKPELGNMAMIVEEWTHLFKDLENLEPHVSRYSPLLSPVKSSTGPSSSENNSPELNEEEKTFDRPKAWFEYPSLEPSEDEKDIQDLDDTKLFVLCVFDNEDKKKISFVWHSEKFRALRKSKEQFVQECVQKYWGSADDVTIIEEMDEHEDNKFLTYLF